VQQVITEFAARDARIRHFRQEQNIGATGNFRFVLKPASGQFFMWASDDDEHAPDFIEKCIGEFQRHGASLGSVMTQGEVHHRVQGIRSPLEISDYPRGQGLFHSLRHHLFNPTPSMIYGLHRTKAIEWFIDESIYDWFDCFFITKILTNGYDVMALQGYNGYTAGIDSAQYTPKPIRPRQRALFEYLPYIRATINQIHRAQQLTRTEKSLLSLIVIEFSMRNFSRWERQRRPVQAAASKLFVLPPIRAARQLLAVGTN
jgi:glycosyltransferase involved in cell wall biosynthesis